MLDYGYDNALFKLNFCYFFKMVAGFLGYELYICSRVCCYQYCSKVLFCTWGDQQVCYCNPGHRCRTWLFKWFKFIIVFFTFMKLLKIDILINRERRKIEIILFYSFIEDRRRWRFFAKDNCYLLERKKIEMFRIFFFFSFSLFDSSYFFILTQQKISGQIAKTIYSIKNDFVEQWSSFNRIVSSWIYCVFAWIGSSHVYIQVFIIATLVWTMEYLSLSDLFGIVSEIWLVCLHYTMSKRY